MRLLKKTISIVLCIFLCVLLLSGCGFTQDELDEANYEGYAEGYYFGYEDGVYDGIEEARGDLTDGALDKYQELEYQASRECGLHPDEAIIVLEDYLDGEYVSDSDLEIAIKSMAYLYYNTVDVIKDIEYMEVSFD